MLRVARIGAGSAMVIAGTAMVFLPGPGLLTIAGGLALLSKDVKWAKRLTERIRQKAQRSSGPG